jgi:hypothetical protein
MPQVLDNAEQLRKALANIDVDAQTYMRESLRRALLSAFNEGIAFASEAAANPKSMHAKFQSARYRSLIGQIRATLGEWNSAAAQQTGMTLQKGIAAAHKVMTEQMQSLGKVGVAIPWNPIPLEAFTNAALFTANDTPLKQIFDNANVKGADRAGQALRTGVLLGRSSSRVANDLSHALRIPAWRGHLIARTELHRVARTTQQQMMLSNAHLYEGWTWRSATDGGTCPICWALHGTFFPMTYGNGPDVIQSKATGTPMPQPPVGWAGKPRVASMISHPNCRCALVPRARSFAEILGDPTIPDARMPLARTINGKTEGELAFAALPKSQQLQVLGPSRFDLYRQNPDLKQFVYVRPNKVWGDSLALRPLCI